MRLVKPQHVPPPRKGPPPRYVTEPEIRTKRESGHRQFLDGLARLRSNKPRVQLDDDKHIHPYTGRPELPPVGTLVPDPGLEGMEIPAGRRVAWWFDRPSGPRLRRTRSDPSELAARAKRANGKGVSHTRKPEGPTLLRFHPSHEEGNMP